MKLFVQSVVRLIILSLEDIEEFETYSCANCCSEEFVPEENKMKKFIAIPFYSEDGGMQQNP